MGPIVKIIDQYLSNEKLSEDTILVLENLKKEIQPVEKTIINNSYHHGYSDKEKGKNPSWNHYSSKYNSYLENIKFDKLV